MKRAASKTGRSPHKPSGIRRNVIIVTLGSIVAVALSFFVTRIYADRYDSGDVSAFLIFRLYSTLLIALSGLGLPVAIQRYVAYYGEEPKRAATISVVGLGIALTSVALCASISAMLSDQVAGSLDAPTVASLWRAFMFLTVSQVFAAIISLTQISRERIVESVVVNTAAVAVAPLIAILALPRADLDQVVLVTAVLTALTALPSTLDILRDAARCGLSQIRQEAAILLRYGIPRGGSNFVEISITAALPWLAVVMGEGLVEAGFLAIGLALIRPLALVTIALNRVLLPASARTVAQGNMDAQAGRVRQIAELSIHLGLFAAFQMVVWGDLVVELWLGETYAAAGPVVRVLGLTVAPVLIFGSLRGAIDGETDRPVNAWNLLISLAPFVVLGGASWALSWGPIGLALSYLGSRCVLAGLTLAYGLRTHKLKLRNLHIGEALVVTLALAALGAAARALLTTNELVTLLGAGFISAGLLVGALAYRRVSWALYLISRLRLQGGRR